MWPHKSTNWVLQFQVSFPLEPVTSGQDYACHSNKQCTVWAWIFCPEANQVWCEEQPPCVHNRRPHPHQHGRARIGSIWLNSSSWQMVKQWPEIKASSLGLQNVARGITFSLWLGLCGFWLINYTCIILNIAFAVNPFQVCIFFSHKFKFKKRKAFLLSWMMITCNNSWKWEIKLM